MKTAAPRLDQRCTGRKNPARMTTETKIEAIRTRAAAAVNFALAGTQKTPVKPRVCKIRSNRTCVPRAYV